MWWKKNPPHRLVSVFQNDWSGQMKWRKWVSVYSNFIKTRQILVKKWSLLQLLHAWIYFLIIQKIFLRFFFVQGDVKLHGLLDSKILWAFCVGFNLVRSFCQEQTQGGAILTTKHMKGSSPDDPPQKQTHEDRWVFLQPCSWYGIPRAAYLFLRGITRATLEASHSWGGSPGLLLNVPRSDPAEGRRGHNFTNFYKTPYVFKLTVYSETKVVNNDLTLSFSQNYYQQTVEPGHPHPVLIILCHTVSYIGLPLQ